MKDFKKIVNPCQTKAYRRNGKDFLCNVFSEITYKNGTLTIHGVVGPMQNGDCYELEDVLEDIKTCEQYIQDATWIVNDFIEKEVK